jgi:hypothetical protein
MAHENDALHALSALSWAYSKTTRHTNRDSSGYRR